MDNLRGIGRDDGFGQPSFDDEDEDAVMEAPPKFGSDERRMQVRAYNYWASLLGSRSLPSIEDLEPESIDDFEPNSVLLDFTAGFDNPAIQYLGKELARECGAHEIAYLSDVPPRSLLSRITDHYMQILANQAPIGFEAEFVNAQGATVLYRGILLPFSSDDDTIDFVYGVINWKELADKAMTDELLSEIEQSLATKPKKKMQALDGWDAPVELDEDPSGPAILDLADIADEPVTSDTFAMESGDPVLDPDMALSNEEDVLDLDIDDIAATDLEGTAPGNMIVEEDMTAFDAGERARPSPFDIVEQDDEAAPEATLDVLDMTAAAEADATMIGDIPTPGDDVADEPLDLADFPIELSAEDQAEGHPASHAEIASPMGTADENVTTGDIDAHGEPPQDLKESGIAAEEADSELPKPEPGESGITLPMAGDGLMEDPAGLDSDMLDEDPVALPDMELMEGLLPEAPVDDTAHAMDMDMSMSASPPATEDEGRHEGSTLDDLDLASGLAVARDLAAIAESSAERTRAALYRAIGSAYDFSLAAKSAQTELESLLGDAGIERQERAPMTPIVKLIFGADYDKTRLAEYAAALSYAHRNGLAKGSLAEHLNEQPGGLKSLVAEERAFRRGETNAKATVAISDRTARKLRKLDAKPMQSLSGEGEEFVLVLTRRNAEGELETLGALPHDAKWLKQAAKKLLG